MDKYMQKHRAALIGELLCIADSYWVLGHWFIKAMLNGRSLTDFNALASFGQDTLGNTRALFCFMEDTYQLPQHQLEFGRTADSIHSMQILDEPPRNWSDFVLTSYIADAAIWRLARTFSDGKAPEISALVNRFGESLHFRRMYMEGWMEAFTDAEKNAAREALSRRLPLASQWFGTEDDSQTDPLLLSNIRGTAPAAAHTVFLKEMEALLAQRLGVIDSLEPVLHGRPPIAGMDSRRRRAANAKLPDGLWEFMVPTSPEAEMARRPLAISISDNLDLFEPQS